MTWQVPWLPSQLPPIVDMQWLAPEETTLDEAELTAEERRYQTFLDKIMHSNQEFIPIGKSCQEVEFEDEEEEEEDEEGEEEEDDSNEEEDEAEPDGEPNDVLMEEEPPDPNFSVNTLIQN